MKKGKPKKKKVDKTAIVSAPFNHISPPKFLLSITFDKETFTGFGETALEALESTPVPIKIVSKGIVKLTNGEKTFEQMWQPFKIKRLFFPNAQGVLAKQLTYLMR